ncbi:hypothetical protein BDB01DRAFT_82832 [Pilobolus umbonatus]|nr:hypothetical protein BDB01DRAFT_82832 [Pilobolus umbonatus]
MYILWVGLLSIFGIRPIIWSIGVAIMTANSPLVNMLSYCYKRIALICRQNTHTKQVHPTAIPIDTQYDHFYRFHIVEHQRWWFHRGWCDTLLPSDRPL